MAAIKCYQNVKFDGGADLEYPRVHNVAGSSNLPSDAKIGTMAWNTDDNCLYVCYATSPSVVWKKLGVGGAIVDEDGTASGVKVTAGTASADNVVTYKIKAYDIKDAHIASGAAITWSKLKAGTASSVMVTNSSGVPTTVSQLPVTQGGIGASSLTANRLLLGNGTSAISVLGQGSNNYVLVGRGSSAPAWVALSTIMPTLTLDDVGDGTTRKLANYLPLAGGTMTGSLKWEGRTALPAITSPQYILAIDAFADGGATKYVTIANLGTAIGLGNYLPLAGLKTVSGLTTFSAGLTVSGGNLTVKTLSGALYGDSGVVKASSTTATELGYVHGVTSAIQTQLDDKVTRYRVYNRNTNTTWNGSIPLWILSLKNGYPLYTDTEFETGANSISRYRDTATVSRVLAISEEGIASAESGTGVGSSSYVLKVVATGEAGFVQAINSKENKVFVQIFRAWLPVGYKFVLARNLTGDGRQETFLTDDIGTGKWEWYVRTSYCGVGGTFSSTGHIYITRVSSDYELPSAENPVTFYLAECNAYDITRGSYAGLRVRCADSADSSAGVTVTNDNSSTLYFTGVKSTDGTELFNTSGITAKGTALSAGSVKVTGLLESDTGIKINSSNQDRYISFVHASTYSWRIGYEGTGGDNANYLVFESSSNASTWGKALRVGCVNRESTFYGVVQPDQTNTRDLGTSSLKWANVYATKFNGEATNVTTEADTSNALYVVGVTSGATTALKRDTSVTVTGGTLNAATLVGTTVKVGGSSGAILKYADSALQVRNSADSDWGAVKVGNLTVEGTITYINTQDLNVADNIITLNSDVTGTPSENAGIEIERGTSTNASLLWDESNDVWKAGLVGSEKTLAFADLSNVSGTLTVAHGGTGVTSLTANRLLIGNGTSAIGVVGVGTTDYVLVGAGNTVPVWKAKAPKASEADSAGQVSIGSSTGKLYVLGVTTVAATAGDKTVYGDASVYVQGGTVGATTFSGNLSGGTISGTTLTASSTVTFSGLGTVAGIVHNNASGVLSSSLVNLASEVIGTLPIGNLPMGTGATQVAWGNHTHSDYINKDGSVSFTAPWGTWGSNYRGIYRDLARYGNSASSVTGTLLIKTGANTSSMQIVRIMLYNYVTDKSGEILVSGSTSSSNIWKNATVYKSTDNIPDVRLLKGTVGDVDGFYIGIGNTDTSWKYLYVVVSELVASYYVNSAFRTGWTIQLVTEEPTWTSTVTPTPNAGLNADTVDDAHVGVASGNIAVLGSGGVFAVDRIPVLGVAKGGVGITSYTAGDMLYATNASTIGTLGIGTSGYVLVSSGSAPTWAEKAPLASRANYADLAYNSVVDYGTDCLAYCHYGTPTQEYTTDGTTWVEEELNKALFSTNATGTIIDATGKKRYRWTWAAGKLSYTQSNYLVVTLTWVSSYCDLRCRVLRGNTELVNDVALSQQKRNVINVGFHTSSQPLTIELYASKDTGTASVVGLQYFGINKFSDYRKQFPYNWNTNEDIMPHANNVSNLGNSSYKWANVYATTFTGNLSGSVSGGTVSCTTLTASSTVKFTGITTSGVLTISSGTVGAVAVLPLANGGTGATTLAAAGIATTGHTHNYAGSTSAGGSATKVTTTPDTSSTLYVTGVKTGDLTTLRFDTSVTVAGGTLKSATGIHSKIFLETVTGSWAHGLSFWQTSTSGRNDWQMYIGLAGTGGCGVAGMVTAPTGTYVTKYAIRSLVSETADSGWTWESCPNGTTTAVTPTIRAELSNTGIFKAVGFVGAGTSITNLNASNLASGTVPLDRLPTGAGSTQVALGNHNHDSVYLKLSGGNMTGSITFPNAAQAFNSEGVKWSGGSSIGENTAGGFGMYGIGTIYIRPGSGTTNDHTKGLVVSTSSFTYNDNEVLHGNNYTDYTVTKTGTGATGTWPMGVYHDKVVLDTSNLYYTHNSLCLLDRNHHRLTRGNKLAFIEPEAISIQYSTDGGETWTDAGYTDAQKANLFNGLNNASIRVGPSTGTVDVTTDFRTRIEVVRPVSVGGAARVFTLDQLFIQFQTRHTCYVDMSYTKYNAQDTFTEVFADKRVAGNAGPNMISFPAISCWSTGSYLYLMRLEFRVGGISTNTSYLQTVPTIKGICGYGSNLITSANKMMSYDSLYSWDNNQTAIFQAGLSVPSGVITGMQGQYTDSANTGALNLNNSDIYGVNSIKFADKSDGPAEGLQWYRGTDKVDSVWVKDGVMYITPNRAYGSTTETSYTFLTTGNWSSTITMNSLGVPSWAQSATKPSYTLDEVGDGSTRKLANYLPLAGGSMAGVVTVGGASYVAGTGGQGLLAYKPTNWTGVTNAQWAVGAADSQGIIRSSNTDLIHYKSGVGSTVILDASNFNTYAPTLTGTGASGSWGIDITGTATNADNISVSSVTTKLYVAGFSTVGTGASYRTIYADSSVYVQGGTVGATTFSGTATNATNANVTGIATNNTTVYYLTGVQTFGTAGTAANRPLKSTNLVTWTGSGALSAVSLTVSGLGSGVVRSSGGSIGTGAINLASADVTGTLAVENGGMGTSTVTGVMVGAGTGAVSGVSTTTANHVLIKTSTGYGFATVPSHTHNYAGSSSAGGSATTVVSSASTSNTDYYITGVTAANGAQYYSTSVKFNASTKKITATGFVGGLEGTATNATNASVTGIVTTGTGSSTVYYLTGVQTFGTAGTAANRPIKSTNLVTWTGAGALSAVSLTLSGLGSGVVRASSGALSVGSVNLASEVSGILPVANGGIGISSISAYAIPYASAANTFGTISIGSTAGYVLAINSSKNGYEWVSRLSSVSTTANYSWSGTHTFTSSKIKIGTTGTGIVTASSGALSILTIASTDAGKVLKVNSSGNGFEWGTASSGVSSLSELTDTTISSPASYQLLYYKNSTDKWTQLTAPSTNNTYLKYTTSGGLAWATITTGSTTLSGLTDTTISNPANNQILYYNGSKWTQLTAPSSANTYLKYDGSSLGWATVSGGGGATTLSGLGDVSLSNVAQGDILWNKVVAGDNVWTNLAGAGTDGYILKTGVSSGVKTLSWTDTAPKASSATTLYATARSSTNTTMNYLLGANNYSSTGNKTCYTGGGGYHYFKGNGELGTKTLKISDFGSTLGVLYNSTSGIVSNLSGGTAGQVLGVNSEGDGLEWVPPGVFKSVLVTGSSVTASPGYAYVFFAYKTYPSEVVVTLPKTYSGVIMFIIPTDLQDGVNRRVYLSGGAVWDTSAYQGSGDDQHVTSYAEDVTGNNRASIVPNSYRSQQIIMVGGGDTSSNYGWYGPVTFVT